MMKHTNETDATETQSMITDHAGNQYPASRLNEPESPGFDVHGARKDAAYRALGNMCSQLAGETAQVHDQIRLIKAPRKHKSRVGQTGKVIWRGEDQWARRSRYSSSFQQAVLASMGNYDRIGVKFADGTVVWTSAKKDGYEIVHRPDPKLVAEQAAAEAAARHQASRARIEADLAAIKASAKANR